MRLANVCSPKIQSHPCIAPQAQRDVFIGIALEDRGGSIAAINNNSCVLEVKSLSQFLQVFGPEVVDFIERHPSTNVAILGGAKDRNAARQIGRLEGLILVVTRRSPGVAFAAEMLRRVGVAALGDPPSDPADWANAIFPSRPWREVPGNQRAHELAVLAAAYARATDF